MADNHDYKALEWVKGEIEETLRQAQQALEAFVENPEDTTRMRFCLTHLHQVQGTLQIVEFYGAALLAEEMELLAQAMLEGAVEAVQDAQEVLMRSILQLPAYLERVKTGRRDVPVVILPLLNDLRAARGEHLLSETAMFKPDLKSGAQAVPVEEVAEEINNELPELLKKIRQLYQFALVGIIRSQDLATNLGHVAKALTKLEQLYSGMPMAQVWWVGSALVEGVSRNEIDLGTSVKMLLGLIDRQLKQSIETGAGRDEPLPVDLLKNLLYYVARCESQSPRIRRVKEAFRLEDALPADDFVDRERRRMSGPDKDTVVSVIKVLLEELAQAKETLDVFLRADSRDARELKPMVAVLKQVGDALAVLGLGNPRRVVLEQIDLLANVVETGHLPPDAIFMDVAGALLYVEATLQGIAADGGRRGFGERPAEEESGNAAAEHVNKARTAVIDESRVGLESVKDAVMEYIGARFDVKCLENVPDILASVRGGLVMVPLQYPADLLGGCLSYICNELIEKRRTPDWRELDTLADAITSVEYYLERLGEEFPGDTDILSIAEDAVAQLGYPLAESPRAGATPAITVDDRRPASVVTLDDVMVDDDVPHIEIPELTESVEARGVVKGAPVKVDLPASGDDIVELDFGDGNEEFEPGMELELDLAEDGDDSVLELDVALDMEDESTAADVASAWGAAKPTPPALAAAPVVPVTPVSTANPSPVATASAGGPVLDDDGDPVDEEVLEIFIEEAGEVVATIREYLPRWRTDNVDHQARAEVRRAYHTLKGSGRLVGAKRLGELAWSVENMLNRVIDNTIPASAQMFALVERVTDVMPEMVLAFQERRLPHVDFAILEAAGHALSKGQVPPPWESVVVQEPAATPAVVEAPSAAEASLLIDADDSELDPILMDIFASEARSHLQTLDEFLADARKQPASFTADVLRALHTLKGSAHMAGIKGVAELAGPTEKFVKECHVQGLQADPDISQFLREFGDVILNAIEHVERYARASVPGSVAMLERVLALRHAKLRHAEEAPEPTAARPDKKLITLFLAESSDLIVDAGDVLRHWEENPVPGDLLESLRRELRVLARSAGAAQLTDIVALAMALEEAYDLVADGLLAPGPVFFEVAHRAHERLVDMMDRIAVGQAAGSVDDLVADIQAVMDQSAAVTQRIAGATAGIGAANLASEVTVAVLADVTPVTATPAPAAPESTPPKPLATSVSEPVLEAADDPELVEIFLEEANDLMESTAHLLHDWISSPDDLDKVAALQRDLHTLKGGARMAGMRQIGDLGHHLENLYEGLVEKRFSAEPSLFDILNKCHDRLAEMVESVTAGGTPVAAPELITAIDGWMRGERAAGTKAAPNAAVTPPPAAPVSAASDFVVPPLPAGMAQVVDSGDVDTEILAVFMEEAEELTEAIDNAIHAWEADRERREPLSDLLRHLHTLKGGARLAGLVTLGNLVHDFETLLMRVEAEGLSVDDVLMADVHVRHDVMFAQYERVKAEGVAAVELPTPVVESAVAPATTLAAEPPHASEAPAAIAAPIVVPPAAVAPLQPAASAAPEMPSFAWQDEDDNKPAAPAESIRVPAELVENLVNLAGETSIIRSRIETEISDFNHVIGDIAQTVGRVRELLRRLDIETETQILAIHQQQAAQSKEYEDFDPLEMDRYSGLHHLSRALGESVSDLLDLKDSLSQRARVTETLLVQQSRINSELQEGLMRTRMVPFTRLAPRLRRIVRQVAGELGKKADLDIVGVDGEMDRTVMDRLVAPLEHMLRNSVDHGIEMPEERVAAGKKEQGRVTLHLSREGGEVVLRLSDDGRGIPLEKVKKRAIERGLMRPDAPLSDKEVLQFIFRPGFSTAEKVTQISGRGVGMDVVHSEIKQLNGSIKIHSYPGAGSQFTVRLPFTVSVNRALMVRVGDDAYAIPLNNIEGIVRISPFELEAYYGPDAPEYEYAGSKYRLRYLGGYVHGQATPNLGGLTKPLPVLLVRGTDHAVALQVDSLIGSREVVVKSVGPQLAAVSGLSGATILGDGSVVIILDISAMIRAEQAQLSAIRLAGETVVAAEPVVPQEQDDDGGSTPVVMVVDDSVTVRKVTSRLLERHGYEVVTAKDGVDAISQLQDIQPDIMLLDIEMPRMDGFEVATLVRHDDRLKDTPIIMITSRTGEKHRERAFAIGVNRYMGKPYQETVLLENIRELLKQHMVVHG